jgi:quinoprotein dehydrogenase-associated probable ABC transporter substrate-binding protein
VTRLLLIALLAGGLHAQPRVLRVAADPNNLPFSNDRGEGFENEIVALVARELGAAVDYTWHAQRRGFFRETLKEGPCDLVAGVPAGYERALTTRPYYRSGYVLVTRATRRPKLRSLDDPGLRELRIGVQMIGDEFMNTPPAHALARRGLIRNIRGFTVYGDYRERDPPARIVEAVAGGEIDAALVWGPLAGWCAQHSETLLTLTPLPRVDALTGQPFTFAIAMGVRRGDRALRDEIDAVLARKKTEIDTILARFGVPLVAEDGGETP